MKYLRKNPEICGLENEVVMTQAKCTKAQKQRYDATNIELELKKVTEERDCN